MQAGAFFVRDSQTHIFEKSLTGLLTRKSAYVTRFLSVATGIGYFFLHRAGFGPFPISIIPGRPEFSGGWRSLRVLRLPNPSDRLRAVFRGRLFPRRFVRVGSVVKDRSECVWRGPGGAGVDYFSPVGRGFESHRPGQPGCSSDGRATGPKRRFVFSPGPPQTHSDNDRRVMGGVDVTFIACGAGGRWFESSPVHQMLKLRLGHLGGG